MILEIPSVYHWKPHTYTFLRWSSQSWWCFEKHGQDQNNQIQEVIRWTENVDPPDMKVGGLRGLSVWLVSGIYKQHSWEIYSVAWLRIFILFYQQQHCDNQKTNDVPSSRDISFFSTSLSNVPPIYLVTVARYISIFSSLQNKYSITSVSFSINKYTQTHPPIPKYALHPPTLDPTCHPFWYRIEVEIHGNKN